MTKVTVKETTAVQVNVDAKPRFESIQDSRGRTIQLRKLDPLQQARLVMAVGGEASQNPVYMNGFVVPAAMVAHIDDDFFGLPTSIKQVESMLSFLGSEGMEAITDHMLAKHQASIEEAEAAESAEQAAAKN
ncbi:hypothetical protein [Pseudomonas petrae]|uniref:hypothetical protein n=1 Tax=Pseudomonas petrae TaxID=2912190 RepID=UPI001F32F3B2|nr:hypothetical protein [Pseudomonas petrae]MCF7536153.1 hypothetical protein [Pseudomonas petrae]